MYPTTSLELSRRLYNAGVSKHTAFSWVGDGDAVPYRVETTQHVYMNCNGYYWDTRRPAFTLAELVRVIGWGVGFQVDISQREFGRDWAASITLQIRRVAGTPEDALGEVLLWRINDGKVSVTEVNTILESITPKIGS